MRRVAGIVLLVTAVLTLLRPMLLQIWVPELQVDTQVLVTVVLQAMLGAALLQGSDGARKVAIGLMVLATLALLGLTPLLLAQGIRSWLVVLAFGLLWTGGILSLLIGDEPSAGRLRASLVVVVIGWVGSFASEIWLLRLPDILLWDHLEEVALPHRVVDESADGVTLSLPDCWSEVPHDPEVFLGLDPQHIMVCTDAEVLATLDVESPLAVDTLADYADLSFRRIRPGEESLVELAFTQTDVDGVPAVSTEAQWRYEGDPYRARILVWKNGWKYVGLVAWSRDSRAEAAGRAFDELVDGLEVRAPLSEKMTAIGEAARELCPHLTPRAVEMAVTPVLKSRPDADLSPADLFRLAYVSADRGLAAMAPAQVAELGRLNQSAFETMSARDRRRLGAWLERVRAGQQTRPSEDRAGAATMARAFQRLPERSQERLRALTQNAIALGR